MLKLCRFTKVKVFFVVLVFVFILAHFNLFEFGEGSNSTDHVACPGFPRLVFSGAVKIFATNEMSLAFEKTWVPE